MISTAWINSYINLGEFVLVNDMLREYNEMKEKIKIPEKAVEGIMSNILYLIAFGDWRKIYGMKDKQNLLIALVDRLLNTVKGVNK